MNSRNESKAVTGVAFVAREMGALLPDLQTRALRMARGDVSLANDVVQDTCERALRFGEQYIMGTNLRAWMMQILFSVYITRYRRTRRERNALGVLGSDPAAWTQPDRFAPPDASLPLTKGVEAQLASLPPGFLAAIKLVDLDDQTCRDAAEILGIPVGTVMSRLHRGRKMLAAGLEAQESQLAA